MYKPNPIILNNLRKSAYRAGVRNEWVALLRAGHGGRGGGKHMRRLRAWWANRPGAGINKGIVVLATIYISGVVMVLVAALTTPGIGRVGGFLAGTMAYLAIWFVIGKWTRLW